MKICANILLLTALSLSFWGCSSSRTFKCSFDDAAEAAEERFKRNEWTKTATRKSVVKKDASSLYIKYYDWEYPDTKIICQVEVVRKKANVTEVFVFVRDHDSWLSPLIHNYTSARKVLDLFGDRLKGGDWKKLPWTPKKSCFKD